MRPLHAISLGLALVVLLVAAWFLVNEKSAPAATHSSEESAPATSAALPHESALEAPPVEGSDRDVSLGAVAEAPAASPSSPAAASKAGDASFALAGRVTDGAGNPVADATVYADGAAGGMQQPLDFFDPESAPWSRRVETTTGADGRFELRPRAQSAIRFAVRAAGFAPYDAERAIAGARHDVGDVALAPSVILNGRVVDTAGRAVAGAKLHRVPPRADGFAFFGGTR